MFVLGLGHRARHGKDSVAREIVRQCAAQGIYAKQYAFADALKAYCRVAFGMREKDARLLQYVGTDIFRERQPDIWVRVLIDTIREQAPDVALVTDMRFPNEADAIISLGGFTMKVERYTPGGDLWVAEDRDPNHPSEIALTDYRFDETVAAQNGDLGALLGHGVRAFDRLYAQYLRQQLGRAS